jgi:hypothetical protein
MKKLLFLIFTFISIGVLSQDVFYGRNPQVTVREDYGNKIYDEIGDYTMIKIDLENEFFIIEKKFEILFCDIIGISFYDINENLIDKKRQIKKLNKKGKLRYLIINGYEQNLNIISIIMDKFDENHIYLNYYEGDNNGKTFKYELITSDEYKECIEKNTNYY